jgi:hypothetical protein
MKKEEYLMLLKITSSRKQKKLSLGPDWILKWDNDLKYTSK